MENILIIGKKSEKTETLKAALTDRYKLTIIEDISRLFDLCLTTFPDLIIIVDGDINDRVISSVSLNLKADPLFNHLPLLVLLDEIGLKGNPGTDLFFDDYITIPFKRDDLLLRCYLCIKRAKKVLEINPLTKLPGNITIIKEIQKKIDDNTPFALAYVDIDFFKPFNDKYGFSRGDEVIRLLGRLLTNVVNMRSKDHGFVGHVGGDDFVFIIPPEHIETVCEEIIRYFDSMIPGFYDPPERDKGFIEATDREGNKKTFPFLSLSIGVAHNRYRRFSHYGQASEIATELKVYAKRFKGSCYKIDRRRE
ncbi:MAG: diguanylate cyclase [Thermodesulfovibrionales bacterium]